jgi:hypothetical protein
VIQVGAGTYTESVSLGRYVGACPPIVRGDSTTPSAVEVIGVGASPCFLNYLTGAHWAIEGFKLTHGEANAVAARGGVLSLKHVEFGAAGGCHMYADMSGHIVVAGEYAISGGAAAHAVADSTGSIRTTGATVTIANTLAFPQGFAFAQHSGIVQANQRIGRCRTLPTHWSCLELFVYVGIHRDRESLRTCLSALIWINDGCVAVGEQCLRLKRGERHAV